MLEIIMSIIAYSFFVMYFRYSLNKYHFNQNISFILALPAFKITSILFIFELHFVIISIIFEFIMSKLNIYYRKRNALFMIIPIPLILSLGLIYYGDYNMNNIIKTEYQIETDKRLSKEYKIGLIADLHYGNNIDEYKLNDIVKRIKKDNCDIVMLAGDIIDEHTNIDERKECFKILSSLNETSKVIYVKGNHDKGKYSLDNKISDADLNTLIESYNIDVLNDEIIEINDEIRIVGRDDYCMHNRLAIDEYNIKDDKYNIVLDHQPKELEACMNNNIDLHLSGHTHAGQIFPLYYLYELLNINELNYGLKLIDDMHAINTSGISGWGFGLRTDHHSEYVLVNIR